MHPKHADRTGIGVDPDQTAPFAVCRDLSVQVFKIITLTSITTNMQIKWNKLKSDKVCTLQSLYNATLICVPSEDSDQHVHPPNLISPA